MLSGRAAFISWLKENLDVLSMHIHPATMLRHFRDRSEFTLNEELWADFFTASSGFAKKRAFLESIMKDGGITATMFYRALFDQHPDLLSGLTSIHKLSRTATSEWKVDSNDVVLVTQFCFTWTTCCNDD